jgi:hypothetical protein
MLICLSHDEGSRLLGCDTVSGFQHIKDWSAFAFDCLTLADEGTMILQNIRNQSPDTESHPGILKSLATLCGDGFMDLIHCLKRKILNILKKIKITTFWKLALLPSSGEWRGRKEEHLLCWAR